MTDLLELGKVHRGDASDRGIVTARGDETFRSGRLPVYGRPNDECKLFPVDSENAGIGRGSRAVEAGKPIG
jgi:hypothetical protein